MIENLVIEKRCSKCGDIKLINDFTKRKTSHDGHCPYCKDCTRKLNRDIIQNNVEVNTDAVLNEFKLKNVYRKCNLCQLDKPIDEFNIKRQNKDGYDTQCKKCQHKQYENHVLDMTDEILDKIAKEHPFKICVDCKETKLISDFSICRENDDGRYFYCNVCKEKRMQEYYQNTIDYRVNYRNSHKDHNSERYWQYNINMKIEVLTYYGNGKCECVTCGEKRLPCLSIDHINNNGNKHRKELKLSGVRFYKWLKDNNFPVGYQTLCMNDQFIKAFERKPNLFVTHGIRRVTNMIDKLYNGPMRLKYRGLRKYGNCKTRYYNKRNLTTHCNIYYWFMDGT